MGRAPPRAAGLDQPPAIAAGYEGGPSHAGASSLRQSCFPPASTLSFGASMRDGYRVMQTSVRKTCAVALTDARGPRVVQVRGQNVLPDAIGEMVVRVLTAPHHPRHAERARGAIRRADLDGRVHAAKAASLRVPVFAPRLRQPPLRQTHPSHSCPHPRRTR
jgi:hypothetical protein